MTIKLIFAVTTAASVSGCGVLLGAGALAATSAVAGNEADYTLRISQMNCAQLRTEYQQKRSEFLGGDFANQVLGELKSRGCRLPA